jgi:hypothetical protein
MDNIQNILLFVGSPSLALETFAKSLGARLASMDIKVEEIDPLDGDLVTCRVGQTTVSVSANSKPLAADQFIGAMDSPLSKTVVGLLSETLQRHSRHMTISVGRCTEETDNPSEYLTRLKIAHAATSLLVEWHMPAAVHWKQSNQLLSGAQYLQLVSDDCPWALFAQARITSYGEIDQMVRNYGIRLEEAVEFIGRPIEFVETPLPLDEIHAAALSFLRHTVETGTPVPDGQTFGPKSGPVFSVKHVEKSEDKPHGAYELSVVQGDHDTNFRKTTRVTSAEISDANISLPISSTLDGVSVPHPRERTRSMAISYLMLVVMPPVGAILLMSNAIFGSSVFRTGAVALASVALAVAVGTFTFMRQGQNNALLSDTSTIRLEVLAD